MRRFGMVLILTCAGSLLLAAPALAANSHKGKVVAAGGGKLTMTDMAGQNQHTHAVAVDATITCGGKPCGLEDLQAGATITVTLEKTSGQTVVTMIREGKAQKASK
jgi:hypothetical protein